MCVSIVELYQLVGEKCDNPVPSSDYRSHHHLKQSNVAGLITGLSVVALLIVITSTTFLYYRCRFNQSKLEIGRAEFIADPTSRPGQFKHSKV